MSISLLVDEILADGTHLYTSTYCRHASVTAPGEKADALHKACSATSFASGDPRRPAQCKTCGGLCRCDCHGPAGHGTSHTYKPFLGRIAEVLRWARANDWRPVHPQTRRQLGQYAWTNVVPDPGSRKQSTLKVVIDVSGEVEVRQLMTTGAGTGWVVIGWFWSGSGRGIVDILTTVGVLPDEMSYVYRAGVRAGAATTKNEAK